MTIYSAKCEEIDQQTRARKCAVFSFTDYRAYYVIVNIVLRITMGIPARTRFALAIGKAEQAGIPILEFHGANNID